MSSEPEVEEIEEAMVGSGFNMFFTWQHDF